jgi:hypothetical protein
MCILFGMSKNKRPAIGASIFPTTHPPYSPDLAIADFYLFGRFKQQLSGRTLDNEENMPETIIEMLNTLPKDKVKICSCIGKKDASGLQIAMGSSIPIS